MAVEEDIYCICRTSDVNRFMIGCDHCEEWYHGDCINVTEKETKYIKKFFCKECTDKNPNLKIVYKSKYMDKVVKIQEEKNTSPEKKEKKEKKKEKKKHKERDKERSRSRERDRHKHKDKKHKKDKSRERDKHSPEDKKDKEIKKIKEEKKARKIISDSDEDITDNIKIEKNNDSEKDREEEKKRKEEKERKERERQKEKEIERERQKLREDKRREKELEKKMNEEAKEKIKKEKPVPTQVKIKQESSDTPTRKPLQVKEIQNINKYGSEDEWKPAVVNSPAQPSQKRKTVKESGPNKRRRAWRPEYDSSEDEESIDLAPRQCYGMDCVNCARVGSKYCSDQCGLTVASLRIYQTLPDRMREWNSATCQAEEKNRKELEKIREDIQNAKQRLAEVDKEAEMLEQIIAKGKTVSIIENKSDDSSESEDESKGTGVINCITCGKDVAARTAIRHMESCFNKFESQTSFGSMYKTRIEGYEMFCDFFNPQTGTYCKRIRVICPEHTKVEKISDTEVCGFPLTKEIFRATGDFCRLPRKVCHDHFSWEKLKRAELDMDRVRQWLKIDELLEKERQEKESMSRRAGVLSLLLHSTYNHELANKINMMKQKKAMAAGGGGFHQQGGGGHHHQGHGGGSASNHHGGHHKHHKHRTAS